MSHIHSFNQKFFHAFAKYKLIWDNVPGNVYAGSIGCQKAEALKSPLWRPYVSKWKSYSLPDGEKCYKENKSMYKGESEQGVLLFNACLSKTYKKHDIWTETSRKKESGWAYLASVCLARGNPSEGLRRCFFKMLQSQKEARGWEKWAGGRVRRESVRKYWGTRWSPCCCWNFISRGPLLLLCIFGALWNYILKTPIQKTV